MDSDVVKYDYIYWVGMNDHLDYVSEWRAAKTLSGFIYYFRIVTPAGECSWDTYKSADRPLTFYERN